MDGTSLDVADTPDNEEEFGRPGSWRGEARGAFPQLRLVGVAECATHALFGLAMGPVSKGETTLARDLLGSLSDGMLVLADRGFFSFGLWNEARATGAELLWRTKAGHILPVDQRLGDGSYLSHLHELVNSNRRPTDVVVRVVDYAVESPGRPQAPERYRLVTTWLTRGPPPPANWRRFTLGVGSSRPPWTS